MPKVVLGLALSIMTSVGLCYYPLAIIYGTYQGSELALTLLIYTAIVPCFISGCVMSLFGVERKPVFFVLASSLGPLLLFALFSGAAVINNLLMLAVVIPVGIMMTRISQTYLDRVLYDGHNHNTRWCLDRIHRLIPTLVIAAFFLFALHPFLSAPMNLETGEKYVQSGILTQPSYYDGLSYSEGRFPTKRVEVGINFLTPDSSPQQNGRFLAGMGVQSPNCCKDGLDYGYRADVLLDSDGKRYLVARTWETCDQNIACGGVPWQENIHEEIVPSPPSDHAELAMEIDDKAVRWLYRLDTDAQWFQFSMFKLPRLGNPISMLETFEI
jgi:hypothetical protein